MYGWCWGIILYFVYDQNNEDDENDNDDDNDVKGVEWGGL